MIINLPTATRWRQKPATVAQILIEMTVTVTLCTGWAERQYKFQSQYLQHHLYSQKFQEHARDIRLIFTARLYQLWPSVCLSVCQVGVLSKQLNESGWFWARELPSTYVCYLQKQKHFAIEICPKLRTQTKIGFSISIVKACYQRSSRKVDALSVINWTVFGQQS